MPIYHEYGYGCDQALLNPVEGSQSKDSKSDRTVLGVIPPKSATKENVTIVLPVLNEEAGIGLVLNELAAHGYTHILVVDGYSTDQTVQVAESKGAEVVSQHGRGKTGAIKTAIDNVSTPYMLIMDGDFTYDAGSIERFLDHAENYEQIIGARSLREHISASSIRKRNDYEVLQPHVRHYYLRCLLGNVPAKDRLR